MSYLVLAAGILPDFSKAVISLWFRAPKESVIAASNHNIPAGGAALMMQNILPLITFGTQQTNQNYHTVSHDVAVIHTYIEGEPDPSTRYDTAAYVADLPYNVDPSFIGLSCYSNGQFSLVFNMQMNTYMSLNATTFVTTQMDIFSGADPAAPIVEMGNGIVGLFPNVGAATIADASYTDTTQPEFFHVQSAEVFESDRWHHLLLSFDVGGSVSIGTPFGSSSCRLWYAIDDKDYRGAENLQPYRDSGGIWGPDDLNPNAILTRTAWFFSGKDPALEYAQYYQNHFIGLPSGSYSGGAIPMKNAPLGIPADARYVDAIFRCEMGELQMWTGVTLDTGVKSNRRAFVDDNGKPVDPTKGTEDDPRAPAERLLGKKPEILLHGSDDWKSGKNTGTLGSELSTDGTATEIPDGQFQPTGGIERYKPDPSLEETTA